MSQAVQLLAVVLVFIGMILSLAICIRIISQKRLYNFIGLLIASSAVGINFSALSFILITISKKFQYWTIDDKLTYAGKIFLWVFLGCLILIPISFQRARENIQQRKSKNSLEKQD